MKKPLLAVAVACAGLYAHAGDEPARTHEAGNDRFVAGGTARVEQPVAGDLFVAGGRIEIAASVAGDAIASGGEVRIEAPVGQDLYAGGGRVMLGSSLGRNARIAGGHLVIGPSARIDGNLTAGGGRVELRGAIAGYVQCAGGRVEIDGSVGGDVYASGGEVTLGPNARIGGRLRYASGAPLARAPAAQVLGGIERIGEDLSAAGAAARWFLRVVCWVWTLGVMALAAVLVLALPSVFARITGVARARPAASLLLGVAALVCVPIAAALLMFTGIGIPFGMLTLLAFAASLQIGFIAGCVALGDSALRWAAPPRAQASGWRAAAAALGVLAVAALARMPWVGVVVALTVLLGGLGALLLHLYGSRTRAAAA